MKKTIALAVTFLLMAFFVDASRNVLEAQPNTYTVSGQIVWKAGKIALKGEGAQMAGKPVVGAKVRIGPGNLTATTDANGRFSIAGVTEGPHTMHVKAREHSSLTRLIEVNENETMNIQLVWRSLWLGTGKRNVQG